MFVIKFFIAFIQLSFLFFNLGAQVQTILISPKQTDPLIRAIHSDHVAYIPVSSLKIN